MLTCPQKLLASALLLRKDFLLTFNTLIHTNFLQNTGCTLKFSLCQWECVVSFQSCSVSYIYGSTNPATLFSFVREWHSLQDLSFVREWHSLQDLSFVREWHSLQDLSFVRKWHSLQDLSFVREWHSLQDLSFVREWHSPTNPSRALPFVKEWHGLTKPEASLLLTLIVHALQRRHLYMACHL